MNGSSARAAFVVIVFAANISIAFATDPPTKQELPKYKEDGSLAERIAKVIATGNHLVSPNLVDNARYRLQRFYLQQQGKTQNEINALMAPPPAWKGMPTKGNVKVLALLIAFSDYPAINTPFSIASKLFGDGDAADFPYESLRNYYRRSSYNQLELQGDVLGWYTTSYPRSKVVENGRESVIKEALSYYDAKGYDFSQYDNDGDGIIDYLIVIWTGPNDGWGGFWSGYLETFADSTYKLDGKKLLKYAWTAETLGKFSPLTVIHETGHALGLPDYYDYNGPISALGGLDMMDADNGDHNCFSKFLLDWISPTIYDFGTNSVALRASEIYPEAAIMVRYNTITNPFTEFFMVQNRYRSGNDIQYPNDGLLIWHVDATLNDYKSDFAYSNSTKHKLLRLMEADGLQEIEAGKPANAGDYYNSGNTFGPLTVPNSNLYNSRQTNIELMSISASGTTMSFTLTLGQACPLIALAPNQYSLVVAGKMYSESISATGGVAPYKFVFSGKVPDEMRITSDGQLSWIFSIASTVEFTVTAIDANSCSGSKVEMIQALEEGTILPSFATAKTYRGTPGYIAGDAYALAVADVNRDGKPDLVTADYNSPSVSVLLGNGNGTFQEPKQYATGALPEHVAVGDFNGDGRIDLAVANSQSKSVSVLMGNGDGTFNPATNYAVRAGATFVAVADFNADGKQDLAVTNTEPASLGYVSIFLNNGDGTFRGPVDYPTANVPWSIAVGDFNRDGKLDLAVANGCGSSVSILFGKGDGTFSKATNIGGVSGPWSVVAGDFNDDGILDLAVSNSSTADVSVYLGNGDGTFASSVRYTTGSNPHCVATGDFNSDGRLDLATANHDSHNISILLGRGDGTFQNAISFNVLDDNNDPIHIVTADLNGDGKPDLVVGNYAYGVSVIINTNSYSATPGAATLVSPSGSISTSSPTYTWNSVPLATWYLLYVNDASTSPKIQQWYSAAQASCASGTGTCSVTPSVALANGSAQWWIQTWNDAGYGPWSSGKSFTISGGGSPGKATLISPSGSISTTTPSYSWNAVSGSTWYYLWVKDAGSDTKIQQWYTAVQAGCSSGTGTCSVSPAVALAQGAAQWWIQTWNDSGSGPWSDAMSFTVAGAAPGKATLISPSGFISTTTPTYTWNAVTGSSWYYLWVNDAARSPKIIEWYTAAQAGCASGTGTCFVTPSVTLASGAAQWWIQTWNPSGYGPWSTGMGFIVP